MDLLVVGTLAFDSVQTPAGSREETLGGSGSFLATAAAYFAPVRLAGVVGQDFDPAHLEFFASRGINTEDVWHALGQTFRWRGQYSQDFADASTLDTQLNVLRDFNPQLSAAARASKYVALGNFDPTLQLQVLDQMDAPTFVACDTMNYWISRHADALRRTLTRVDLLCVNEAEARQLSGEHDLMRAAQAIFAMGPKHVVIKRGACGALLFYQGGALAAPAYLVDKVCDPTGAGDSFAGSMVGYLARRQDTSIHTLRHAVAVATVLASFVVEDFSLDRLRRLDISELRKRLFHYHQTVSLDLDMLTL